MTNNIALCDCYTIAAYVILGFECIIEFKRDVELNTWACKVIVKIERQLFDNCKNSESYVVYCLISSWYV